MKYIMYKGNHLQNIKTATSSRRTHLHANLPLTLEDDDVARDGEDLCFVCSLICIVDR